MPDNKPMPPIRWYYPILAIPFYLLACLPGFLRYGLSDILRFLVFYVFGYRKKVVFENLRNAFPDMDKAWIKKTAWRFYQNLFDTTLETLTMAVVRKSYYDTHVAVSGLECIKLLNQKQQPFILVCGHLANWEWAGQSLQQQNVQVDVLYHPLSNPMFNWLMYHIRSRFGIYPIPMQSALREMLNRKNIPSAITFIADQTPSSEGCHWMTFLNQETPVFLGVEKLAKKMNYPVVYGEMARVGRGKYTVEFQLLVSEPNKTSPFEITERHMRLLEKQIRNKPEDWLWSHRRWKHKRGT